MKLVKVAALRRMLNTYLELRARVGVYVGEKLAHTGGATPMEIGECDDDLDAVSGGQRGQGGQRREKDAETSGS